MVGELLSHWTANRRNEKRVNEDVSALKMADDGRTWKCTNNYTTNPFAPERKALKLQNLHSVNNEFTSRFGFMFCFH